MINNKILLSAICLFSFSNSLWAQVYACQNSESSGFYFENNQWIRSAFKVGSPFFLKIQDGKITQESAAKVIGGVMTNVRCSSTYSPASKSEIHTCSDYSSQLLFAVDNGSGAVAQLLGAASANVRRDSVEVTLFNCQKM